MPTDQFRPSVKDQLPIILSFLDDARRIIEGGKGRRWEVFRWTIALNVIITTASLAKFEAPIAPYALLALTGAVSATGYFLIEHYDRRVTKARDRARELVKWLATNFIDIYTTMGEDKLIPTDQKDTFERAFFYCGIGASFLAVGVALSLK